MTYKRGLAVLIFSAFACAMTAQDEKNSSQSVPTLTVDVDLVIANATVTDANDRFVTGLQKEHFRISEDKVQQEIAYFSSEDVPLSVGIIFDVSGSMKDKLKRAQEADVTFLKGGSLDDEYFLVPFADKPLEVTEFTSDIARIQSRFMFSKAKGSTALYDAVYLGLNKLESGEKLKKALLLITDGEDNRSRYTFSNVKKYVQEKDVQIYAIGIMDSSSANTEQGRAILRDLASVTGGNAFFTSSVSNLEDICRKIALELKNQYVIGYHSTNADRDGKWRKIKVTAKVPEHTLSVRAKSGYYAPTPEGVKGGKN